jgi:hypothetical protein
MLQGSRELEGGHMKQILGVYSQAQAHWVGDGFPVRSLFSYNSLGEHISPFLLLDYGGPHDFAPAERPRGVGQHPHRGFETVTIVYDGEVAHRDSTGKGGTIGPGDVQWMTAAGGILHDEFHSPAFTARGGRFRMVQLWVNLPAKDKLSDPGYQAIAAADIPTVAFEGGALRVIAGDFAGKKGPARTFSPVNVWDLRLDAGGRAELALPEGHNSLVVVLAGEVLINGAERAGEAQVAMLERAGSEVTLAAGPASHVLILTGEPLAEPIAGYGPFVMNTEDEIRTAIADFNSGKFGQIAA